MMIILAYIGALLVGFTLGLFGGGGSILTVPIFVYLLNIDPSQATAYSLFVVGVSAILGALKYMRKGLVNYHISIIFAIPSFLAIYLTRRFFMPSIPDTIISWGDVNITTDIIFGLVIIIAFLTTAFFLIKANLNQTERGKVIKVFVLIMPAAISVFVMRQYVIPIIPDNFFYIGDIIVTKRLFIMAVFVIVMFYAGYSMIRTRSKPFEPNDKPNSKHHLIIMIYGFIIGILTGVIGAGGGFLLVPALVFFANLPIRLAIGTSLLIISANSLVGFLGDISYQKLNWQLLLSFTTISMCGIFLGTLSSKYLNPKNLKKSFGYFILGMSTLVTVLEILKL